MHLFFEYLPLIIFFILTKFADFYWATGSLIVTTAIQLGYYRFKKEKIPTRHWIIFALVLVFGGLTIYLQNDAFIKWKVTIINLFFAIALIVSNHIFNKNIIKQFLAESLTLPDNVWSKLNLAWAVFFASIAALNLYVAYNFDLETWVDFKVFGLTGLMFVFSIITILFVHKYMPDESEDITNAIEDSVEITSNVVSKPQHNKDNDKI
ncbi:MAG: septation protein A [Colwellia sp.]|nr:septation protein A [Colwellia sp.]